GLPGPDIGYAVLSEFAGQGYAGEAAHAVLAHARAELGIEDLYGITELGIVASGKILLGLGMHERGVIQLPGIESASRL
ncbi:GNAT family N-acetyltransferase, partial [Klebsiella pneumoniae]|uniref:GNAT family N-acetyltransferase n=1 Tax=Klebsiella pneumoniae TaxID=573 RepID=UPI003F204F41